MIITTTEKVVLTMPDRCHFDPTTVHCSGFHLFNCPECGEQVIAGSPHPTAYDDRIEWDHAVVEWVEEHKDDS